MGGWRLNCELKSAFIPNAYLNTIHYPVHVESTGLTYSGVEGSAGRGGGSVGSSSTKQLNSNPPSSNIITRRAKNKATI